MKKILNIENIVLLLTILAVGLLLHFEFSYKKNDYLKEKIYDLELQYNEKVISNKRVAETLFREVLENNQIAHILNEANSDTNIVPNRIRLYTMLNSKYERMKKSGILQLHFHLANGDSFLRFHKLKKSGDSLLFRDSIKKVINTKKPAYGFEVGKFFDGFRYVYPIFKDEIYVGSVELSISVNSVLKQMKESLDADYSMIVKKDIMEATVVEDHLKKYYHKFCASDNYFMSNSAHSDNSEPMKKIIDYIREHIDKDKAFAQDSFYHGINKIFIFVPIKNVSGNTAGYIISARNDNSIYDLVILQSIKYLIGILITLLIFYFYRQSREKTNTIEQLQNAIDKTTLVSKTDLKGKITYVNEAFVQLSGYTKEELLGQPHSVVRHSDTSSKVFKDMWKTIKSGNIWHGKIKNRKKDGNSYIVDVSIFPIKNENNVIVEYIAIRHDITELEELKEILQKELSSSNESLQEKMNLLSQYEKAIESAASFTRTDTNGAITYLNDTHEKLTGFLKEELIGKKHTPLLRDENISSEVYKELWETITSKKNYNGVITNKTKSGDIIYLDTLIVPILDLNDNIVEYMSIQYDISDVINVHKEIEETQREVIYKMGEIGESRSKETGNHVKRVAEYSRLLACKYGLPEEESELLYDASPMHDIGKVGIPDNVLKKPGKLDADEWVIMRTHSEIGFNVLSGSNRAILKAAATVAYEHHEKYDGSGYPKGLKGEEIHIYGRITALADVFDALGSDRVYKQAWSDGRIFDLFKSERGKHFDPKLVDIFFENLDQFLEIRDKFRD
ncbi:PAS domain S-box protein [Sulfurimonas sp.]|uniref:PAS domain S-box protein n=1 Tax=Sulfurimonas sp. TaxID=2022749 RepID=UPI0035635FF1